MSILGISCRSIYIFKAFHYRLFYNLASRLKLMFHKNPWKLRTTRQFLIFPKKRRVYTVLRSTHTDKKSREQFELHTSKRLLVCFFQNKHATNLLLSSGFRKYFLATIPAGIGLDEKLIARIHLVN